MKRGQDGGRSARRAGASRTLAAAWALAATGAALGGDAPATRARPIPPPAPRDVAARRASTTPSPSVLRADAGDDQIGLVGRRITLNGGRSGPRGDLAYRWIAMAGPSASEADQEGPYFSFVPQAAGTYRFGLVVAGPDAGGSVRISEPDEVVVTVGEAPSAVGLGAATPAVADDAVGRMLQGPGAEACRATLERAAGVFDAIAGRASLYTSFDELSAEMMRRLDAVVPADPAWRRYWSEAVFAPLTEHLAAEMLAAGLDLRDPRGRAAPLAQAHRERLERLLASYAREFRARSQAR